MSEFLPLLIALAPLMEAGAAFLKVAVIVLAVWTPLSFLALLLIGPSLWRRR